MDYAFFVVPAIVFAIGFFFISLAGGFKKSWQMVRGVFAHEHAKSLLGAFCVLFLLIILGASVTRDGLIIRDIVFFFQ